MWMTLEISVGLVDSSLEGLEGWPLNYVRPYPCISPSDFVYSFLSTAIYPVETLKVRRERHPLFLRVLTSTFSFTDKTDERDND